MTFIMLFVFKWTCHFCDYSLTSNTARYITSYTFKKLVALTEFAAIVVGRDNTLQADCQNNLIWSWKHNQIVMLSSMCVTRMEIWMYHTKAILPYWTHSIWMVIWVAE